jgi:DNA primase
VHVKELFYDNSAGFGGNSVQFIMKKYPTMNFFEAVEKVAEITGIVLEYEEQSEDAKKIHDEILSMKRSFNFALINTKEIQQPTDDWAKQMMLTDRGFSRDIARIYDWLCS